MRLAPNDADTFCARAIAYAVKHDLGRAIADFTRAIGLAPKSPEAYYGRANAHVGNGDFDKAITDFTEAIRLDPNYADSYYGRARAFEMRGDKAKAEQDRRRAESLRQGTNPRGIETQPQPVLAGWEAYFSGWTSGLGRVACPVAIVAAEEATNSPEPSMERVTW